MLLLYFIAVITTFLLIGTILHTTYFKTKVNQISPYGEMIPVFDGQMHIYQMGTGDKTVVLLPGLGVPLPCADFGPLMRQLGEHYTVVCVEYLGVGFSTATSRPRTTNNYVEEIRLALSNAGIAAPYIFMPHSISSVYSEFYAAKYPDEVEAIISLDGTSSAYIGEDMPSFVKSLLGIAKIQQNLGLTSLLAPLTVKRKDSFQCGYTKKEVDDMVTFAGFTMNDNVLDQMRNSVSFVKDTNETTYPDSVPYYKIISKQTYETKNKQIKLSPKEYQQQHLARVNAKENYEVLDGNHFIYQKNAEKIADCTINFLGE